MAKIKPTKPSKKTEKPAKAIAKDESRQTKGKLSNNYNESRQTKRIAVNNNESRQTKRIALNKNESRQTKGGGLWSG